MHELAIAQQLAAAVVEAAAEHRVRKVLSASVRIGALTCLQPESLAFAFKAVSEGMGLEGCRLSIERVALVVRCGQCGYEGEQRCDAVGCPACDAPGLSILSGREIELCAIEVDDAPEGNDDA